MLSDAGSIPAASTNDIAQEKLLSAKERLDKPQGGVVSSFFCGELDSLGGGKAFRTMNHGLEARAASRS